MLQVTKRMLVWFIPEYLMVIWWYTCQPWTAQSSNCLAFLRNSRELSPCQNLGLANQNTCGSYLGILSEWLSGLLHFMCPLDGENCLYRFSSYLFLRRGSPWIPSLLLGCRNPHCFLDFFCFVHPGPLPLSVWASVLLGRSTVRVLLFSLVFMIML